MTDPHCFNGSFTQQEPVPQAGVEAAVAILRSGRLHRYNLAPGERSETSALEVDFAASVGARYCLACASGGYAMQLALRAWPVPPGAPVLTNAFTLSPVPGAIVAVGGVPILVETTRIDLSAYVPKRLLQRIRGSLAFCPGRPPWRRLLWVVKLLSRGTVCGHA